jgi:hypothetical protein
VISIPTLVIGVAIEGPVADKTVIGQIGWKGRSLQFIANPIRIGIIDTGSITIQIGLGRECASSIIQGGGSVVVAGGCVGATRYGCCSIVQRGDFFL